MAILSFTPSYTAVVAWDKDRLLLRRESQQARAFCTHGLHRAYMCCMVPSLT